MSMCPGAHFIVTLKSSFSAFDFLTSLFGWLFRRYDGGLVVRIDGTLLAFFVCACGYVHGQVYGGHLGCADVVLSVLSQVFSPGFYELWAARLA